MRGSELGQGENGIIFDLNMSGEMHMWIRDEVFGCIPHNAPEKLCFGGEPCRRRARRARKGPRAERIV